ncbi:PaaI family thioesterase [Cognatazoarcus halotolerans]|uniref:PaaI family thioesterase n=1 Tax=Cognatazoarcus halotolerans TaxID=2686016 RepID=UPI001359CF5C|nr:PaaI family thioesterase [Cognatazoarcus halotolerans]MCB1901068.1 PaaI family thioesterase [Rhodocyclaceae bacterium]MCP5307764.1 PaaI family thioesterase [Zoogloeaceae bacterium]
MHKLNPDCTLEGLNKRLPGSLPGWFGIEMTRLEPGLLVAEMVIRPEMLAPNGFLHAASVIALADTCAGFATIAHLPRGAENFTTVELKSNFLGTQTEGALRCVATAVHTGRMTQVWDAEVVGGDGRRLALFRCTQMILWPKAA